jgi:hypothetical protein
MVVGDADSWGENRATQAVSVGKSAIWWGARRQEGLLPARAGYKVRRGGRSGAPSRFFFVAHLQAKVFGFRGNAR